MVFDLVGALRPVRPLLKPPAPAIVTQPYHPQVAVLLPDRIAVPNLDPHHRRITIDRHNLAGEGKGLTRTIPLLLPYALLLRALNCSGLIYLSINSTVA